MKTLWLLGSLGLGAGLMYVLDPEKGAGRRDFVRGSVEDYGRQTGALLDKTRRTLGRQAQAVLATHRMPFRHQPGPGERLRTQVEEWGLPLGLGLLGCVGLGVGLGALLEPQGGPSDAPGSAHAYAPTGNPRQRATRPNRRSIRPGASSKATTRSVWTRIPGNLPEPRPGMQSRRITRVLCSIARPLSRATRQKPGLKLRASRRTPSPGHACLRWP